MSSSPHVVILGAGVTGLSAAYFLRQKRPDLRVTLLERSARVGGNIVTEQRDGFLLDGGPDSFLRTKPQAVRLCKELGLEQDLITVREESRAVYVAHDGQLALLPAGLSLAVPTRLGPMLETPLLSWPGKLRMLGDLLLPAHFAQGEGDESIADFVARRFGREAAERLAPPLLGGIFAGDVRQLSVRATFPQLLELERAHRSVIYGMFAAQRRHAAPGNGGSHQSLLGWLRRSAVAAESPFFSLKSGMGSLIARLAQSLRPGALRTSVTLRELRAGGPGEARWRLGLDGGEQLTADAVLLATPAHAAAALVPDPLVQAELQGIPYVSTATVFFGLEPERLARPLDGIGFVVPEGEGRLLAGTWVTSKWSHRAPAGKALVRAFLGGHRDPDLVRRSTDAELVRLAWSELERLMGSLGEPLFTRVFRYVDSNPQPVVGHAARVARIHSRLRQLPGLYVAGAAYDGIGVPDCVRQAEAVVDQIVADGLKN